MITPYPKIISLFSCSKISEFVFVQIQIGLLLYNGGLESPSADREPFSPVSFVTDKNSRH